MKKLIMILGVLSLILAGPAFAADTVLWSHYESRGVGVAVLDWGDAVGGDGAVTATSPWPIDGNITCITTIPDGGATQPDDNYYITGYYANAKLSSILSTTDQFATKLTNRDEATTETVIMTDSNNNPMPFVWPGAITFAITNAGAGNGGIIIIKYSYRQETR